MHLTRSRLTVCRLMALVALLGVLLGVGIEALRLYRLSQEYAGRAYGLRVRMLSRYEKGSRKSREEWLADFRAAKESDMAKWTSGGTFQVARPLPPEVCRIKADHYRALVAKYDRASRCPWLPVEPDPPPPEPAWTEPE